MGTIKPRSDKRSKEETIYKDLRRQYLNQHDLCKAKIVSNCSVAATEIHHKKGRIGFLLINTTFWLPVCRACHNWIEQNPITAKGLGFSLSRLETEENDVFEETF